LLRERLEHALAITRRGGSNIAVLMAFFYKPFDAVDAMPACYRKLTAADCRKYAIANAPFADDLDRHPDNEATPGALVFRPESSLFYFNIDHVCTTILDRVRQESNPPRLVVLDLSAAPYVDLQSSHALADLGDELHKKGSRVQVVEARAGVRDRLHGEGLDARLALLTPDLSIHRYRCVLQIFYGFYAPVEAGLLRLADVAPALGLPLRARAELLGDDLLTLGMSRRDIAALPLCTDLPRLVCLEELAGCLYVLEGACLGGQAIAPLLQRRLAVTGGSGASFFVGDGAATAARWARVVAWLDELVGARARSEDIVASACATFLTLTRWVEQQQASQGAPWST
jgi:heme oxygenase